ncbi:MAG: hypothetical protein Q9188_007299 [Gyalolechia gomerana]
MATSLNETMLSIIQKASDFSIAFINTISAESHERYADLGRRVVHLFFSALRRLHGLLIDRSVLLSAVLGRFLDLDEGRMGLITYIIYGTLLFTLRVTLNTLTAFVRRSVSAGLIFLLLHATVVYFLFHA